MNKPYEKTGQIYKAVRLRNDLTQNQFAFVVIAITYFYIGVFYGF